MHGSLLDAIAQLLAGRFSARRKAARRRWRRSNRLQRLVPACRRRSKCA